MQRYFIEKECVQENIMSIHGDDARHMTKVMRMKAGDIVQCIVDGRTATCEITDFTNESVHVHVVEWIEESNELPIHVTIASGLPKGDKLEYIVQKSTELGAAAFLPFSAARSIVKWDEKKGKKKVERLEKIAKEAAEQSYRTIIPHITNPISFKQLLAKSSEYDMCIVAYEEDAKSGESKALKRVFDQLNQGQKLLVVFGPEGGLAEEEITQLEEAHFVRCSLGSRILRTETAPLYVLSAVSYNFELSR
jgi:16S rRNA (uracil1498-N3)-methyltransferase